MRELVQKLFEKGKMATPQAIEIIREKGLKTEDILGLEADLIDPAALEPLLKKVPRTPEKEIQQPQPKVEVKRDRKKKLAEEYSVDFSLENCTFTPRERKAVDFTNYFNSRFMFLQSLLVKRLNPMSIANISRSGADSINIIGMVNDIRTTGNGNKIIELEDPSGRIACLASRNVSEQVSDDSNNLLLDEVIGVSGSFKNGLFFVKEIIRPEIPITNNHNRLDVPLKAVFISDIHFGSKDFLEDTFRNFLKWINSKKADAVKYVFVAGDLCDGLGIYIGQENELFIREADRQYAVLADLMAQIPAHMKIIACPGNHDIVGNHEPQQLLDFTALSRLPNIVFATNPAAVTLDNKLRILMYHGYSYDDVIAELPRIRHDGYDKPCLPMLEVLKRRHLSPAYGGSLIVPESRDCLVIDKVPDIFHSGHLHTVGLDTYRNVTMINSGTFQGRTGFQEKMGHHPHPGIFVSMDLMTRKTELVNLN